MNAPLVTRRQQELHQDVTEAMPFPCGDSLETANIFPDKVSGKVNFEDKLSVCGGEDGLLCLSEFDNEGIDPGR